MERRRNTSSVQSLLDSVFVEAMRRGPILTFLVMAVISGGAGYLIYSYLLDGWMTSNRDYRQAVIAKEVENKKTETMLAGEPQVWGQVKKGADPYPDAKTLFPGGTGNLDWVGAG